MPYALFHDYFPDVAEHETRTITVLDHSTVKLPPGHYSFHEMFCDERGCDCRRVFFYVVSSLREDVQAVIAWGWEQQDFYAKWMGDNNPHVIADLKGPVLNLASPQSYLAPAILDLVGNVLLQDAAYIERVKRHYAMFRKKIDSKDPAAAQANKDGEEEKGDSLVVKKVPK